ncbi:hypothetical protein HQ393_04930 [Chitinibacter bivalviorum]|uniref:Uncharacterized protein n=1 Tax=Chitinibacter bivalviorum TaxID=2739434 RepID=A0A7H9BG21_9NEIS|nr:hypothetical protein [Chitinibacter bivalviorum]QLG87650.1 hypothetical protein HQ393_04930 [Chitinibacter bivalviorum]
MNESAMTVTASGINIAATATSASAALPQTSNGTAPKYVRIAATAETYVKLGTSAGVTASSVDLLVQPADAVVLRCWGFTHIAALAGSTSKVSVVPLEDQ